MTYLGLSSGELRFKSRFLRVPFRSATNNIARLCWRSLAVIVRRGRSIPCSQTDCGDWHNDVGIRTSDYVHMLCEFPAACEFRMRNHECIGLKCSSYAAVFQRGSA